MGNKINEVMRITENMLRETIEGYFRNLDHRQYYFHPLDLLIKKERRLRSIVGGIETKMGSEFWPKLAREVAILNGLEIIENDELKDIVIPSKLERFMNTKNKFNNSDDVVRYFTNNCKDFADMRINKNIKKSKQPQIRVIKNNIKYVLKFKTAHPNDGKKKDNQKSVMREYLKECIYNRNIKIQCMIVYPYEIEARDKEKVFFVVCGEELWDKILGSDGTYKCILKVFEKLQDDKYLSKLFEKNFYGM